MRPVIKSLYEAVPLKKQLFSALKLVWKPKESVFRHLHFKGVFEVRVDATHSFLVNHYGFQIENEIFWLGLFNGWEKDSMRIWTQLCKESEVIFDIGANTGIYALVAKTINRNASVHAFEPVERVYRKLQANIDLNNFDIKAVKKAASDSSGHAVIFDTDSEHTLSVAVNKNITSPGTKVIETVIETITLDSYIIDNNIKKVDLIKIDVESHEPEVLQGFSGHLSKFKPTILIEILSDEIGSKVESLLDGLGYIYFNIDEKGNIRRSQHLGKSDHFNFLVCNQDVAKNLGLL